jgi:hypothetical protein
MSDRRSLYRKVGYVLAMAALLLPLAWMSAPATRGGTDGQESAGGKLAQLRMAYGLSQANLGEIDPASETIKLATLGMRGVATNLLWEKANHYKKTEDWTNLSATLEQITKLQPNFVSVWQFQGWNLSYNVSAEFDDYRDRYYWVTRGINFLKEGERYNQDEPRLLWDIGWFIAHKIGRADEHQQFRKLFRNDDDFHGLDRPRDRRDNWLVGKESFLEAQDAVDLKGRPLRIKGKGKSEVIFYAEAPMCQMNYGETIESEGMHDEVARQAWKLAGREWNEYGNRRLLHSAGHRIRLNDAERLQEEAKKLETQLDELLPGLREKIREERTGALTEIERQALKSDPRDRSEEQFQLVLETQRKMEVTPIELAQRIGQVAPEKKKDALLLADAARKNAQHAHDIDRYRQIVNFEAWRTRCEVEQTPEALAARAKIYQGDQEWADADAETAKKRFDEGFANWRIVLDRFPSLRDDPTTGDDLMEVIKRYRQVLDDLDESFPQDFILRDIIQQHDVEHAFADIFGTSDVQEKSTGTTPP